MTAAQNLYGPLKYLLNGKNLEEKQHEAIMLLTPGEDGWPHAAMISVGEIAATGETTIRTALWPGTRTAANLRRTGRATLSVVYEGTAYYVTLRCFPLLNAIETTYDLACFKGDIVEIRQDHADYAALRTGIQVDLHQPAEVLQRWQTTIKELINT